MTKRYSIMVIETGATVETELCRVDTNPAEIAKGAAALKLGKGKGRVDKYSQVWVVDTTSGKTILRY